MATTCVKMAEIQAELGFGVKKFQLVWVFETDKTLNDFIKPGWEFGAGDRCSKNRRQGRRVPGSGGAGGWLY
jgi:hypothetical protein